MTLPTAAEMRAQLDHATTVLASSQLQRLATRIREANQRGHSSIQERELAPGVKEKLEAAGYQVKLFTPPQWDGDPSYWTVSW